MPQINNNYVMIIIIGSM